jgi:hypothetical protein
MKFKSLLLLLCLVVSSCNKTTQVDDPITKKEDFTVPPTNVDVNYPFRIVRVNPNPNRTAYSFRYRTESLWLRNYGTAKASWSRWSISTNSVKPSFELRSSLSSDVAPNGIAPFDEVFGTSNQYFGDVNDTVRLLAPDKTVVQTIIYDKAQPQISFMYFEPAYQLRIQFVIPRPSNSQSPELIIVENMTSANISLTGWKFRSKGGQVKNLLDAEMFATGIPVLVPGGLALYSENRFEYSGANWLNNDGDNLELVDPSGKVVQTITWGAVSAGQVIIP